MDSLLGKFYYEHQISAASTIKFKEKLTSLFADLSRLIKKKHLSLHDVVICATKQTMLFQLYVNRYIRKYFGKYDEKIAKTIYKELRELLANSEYDELCAEWRLLFS